MMTPTEARTFLAEQLREKILYDEKFDRFHWRDSRAKDVVIWLAILETEWQQIALWVEEKMTDEQKQVYAAMLHPQVNKQTVVVGGNSMARHLWADFIAINANYINRATAMKEAGVFEV